MTNIRGLMKKLSVFILVMFVLCQQNTLLWASGVEPTANAITSDTEAKAQEALESLRHSYAERDLEGFFESVSDKSYFSWLDLKIRLSRTLSDLKQIDLTFVLNHSVGENNKAWIKIHWEKRAMDRIGNSALTEGNAQLLFVIEEEKAKLLDIQDDSPF